MRRWSLREGSPRGAAGEHQISVQRGGKGVKTIKSGAQLMGGVSGTSGKLHSSISDNRRPEVKPFMVPDNLSALGREDLSKADTFLK